jgi:hypothetical protein
VFTKLFTIKNIAERTQDPLNKQSPRRGFVYLRHGAASLDFFSI